MELPPAHQLTRTATLSAKAAAQLTFAEAPRASPAGPKRSRSFLAIARSRSLLARHAAAPEPAPLHVQLPVPLPAQLPAPSPCGMEGRA